MKLWQSVFAQSRVNDGYYVEDLLPNHHWEWPKGTWFQTRLDSARDRSSSGGLKTAAGSGVRAADWVESTPQTLEKAPRAEIIVARAPSRQRSKKTKEALANKSSSGLLPAHPRSKVRTKSRTAKKLTQESMCAT